MIPTPSNHLYEIETKLLGAYMSNADLFDSTAHLVSENIFLRQITRKSYTIIKTLHTQRVKPDLTIVYNELKKLGFPTADLAIVGSYTQELSYLSQPEKYVDILFKKSVAVYLMPKLQNLHSQLLSETGDVIELLSELKDSITNVDLVVNNVTRDKTALEVFDDTITELKTAMNPNAKMGMSTGLKEVDAITGGLYPGIMVIGARPGAGKTSVLINIIVENAIKGDTPVIFFSLEMPKTQLMRRVIANACEVNSFALKTGQITQEDLIKIEQFRSKINDNLIIDDTPGVTWQYIDAKIRRIRKKIPIEKEIIVAVDYLQLMTNTPDEMKGRTDEALMSIRCSRLNSMWKTYNCCIIELSQLGREVEKRSVQRPIMSDLKESGSIEANADAIMLMYRPDYYTEFPKDDQGRDLRGLVEFILAKNRHGKTKSAYARFQGQYAKFTDYIPETNPF